eukprot:SAG31_NODE_3024_length_4780_cov_2.631275_3_plen_514_part_00
MLSKKTIAVRLQAYFDPADPARSQISARRTAIEDNKLEVHLPRQVPAAAAATVSACNTSWHEGDVWEGHDIKKQVAQTCDECAALCAADPSCSAVVWNAPGGLYSDRNCNLKSAAPPKPWKTDKRGEMGLVIRPNQNGPDKPVAPPSSLDFSVQWMEGYGATGPISPATFKPINPSLFSPALAPAEQTRVDLQQNLTNGWGTWANSVLDLVLMPEGARITVGLCQISSGKCITSTRPSDTGTMRVAEHAYDKSYVRMFLTFQQANVSVEFSSGTGDQASELDLAVTPLNCDEESGEQRDHDVVDESDGPTINCSDFTVTVVPSWAWGRAGTWDQASSNSLTAQAAGLRGFTLYATSTEVDTLDLHPRTDDGSAELIFILGRGGGVSTKPNQEFVDIQKHMSAAHTAVHAKHAKYGDLSEVANAVQSAVMWCLLYVPSELGPFAPVSRSWAFLTPARAAHRTDEWVYVIFESVHAIHRACHPVVSEARVVVSDFAIRNRLVHASVDKIGEMACV